MRDNISCSSFRRLLLAAFFVLLLMKQGALPVLAQSPSPTPAATTTITAENAADKEQEAIEPVDISLKDLEFLPTLLARPPLLFTFSMTLAMFLTALIIGIMPLSLWARLIGLAPPRTEEVPLPEAGAPPTATEEGQVVNVQQVPGAQAPPAVVEQQPNAPSSPPSAQPPPGTPAQAAQSTPGSQPGQSSPQQAQAQQASAPQGEQGAQPGTAQQGAPGQPAPQPQTGQQAQAQGQGSQPSQQQGAQPQQGGQAGTTPTPQADQGGLQGLLGNQEEEEEDSLAGIDEDIQNILSGVFGEEEGIDPRLEYLATLLEDIDMEEIQKTLQQVARILQRKKRK